MRERARWLGGTLVIESEPGEGTRVSLAFPRAGRRNVRAAPCPLTGPGPGAHRAAMWVGPGLATLSRVHGSLPVVGVPRGSSKRFQRATAWRFMSAGAEGPGRRSDCPVSPPESHAHRPLPAPRDGDRRSHAVPKWIERASGAAGYRGVCRGRRRRGGMPARGRAGARRRPPRSAHARARRAVRARTARGARSGPCGGHADHEQRRTRPRQVAAFGRAGLSPEGHGAGTPRGRPRRRGRW